MLDQREPFLVGAGTLPLVITMVHAATLEQSRHGPLPERIEDDRFKRYEIALFPLLAAIVAGLERRGGRPYLVVPLIHRSRIDFNRGKQRHNGQRAYDDPQAEAIYNSFDALVAEALAQALAPGRPGLLLDLHGCTTDDADLFLGTLNGRTVGRFGGQPFAYGRLRDALSAQGWRVAPPMGERETRYVGRADGVIGRHNLADSPHGGTSMQLEVSRYIRVNPLLNARFGDDLAAALTMAITP